MAKKSYQKSSKAGAPLAIPPIPIRTPKSKSSQISDKIRQAIKDLGGDDDDLELINGVDDDDEEPKNDTQQKGKSSDEVSGVNMFRRRKIDMGRAEVGEGGSGGFHEGARFRRGSSSKRSR